MAASTRHTTLAPDPTRSYWIPHAITAIELLSCYFDDSS